MQITTADFRKAKAAAKKALPDSSAAHRAAMNVLKTLRPEAPAALLSDMGWQAVLAAR